MTADDFEPQPRGPYLFNFWHARPRVRTPFGEFTVEAHMPLEDTKPPDDEMVRQANALAEFTRRNANAILDKIDDHYRGASAQLGWMESCDMPLGLHREALAPYLDALNLVVDRDGSEPTIYVVPRWDHEHAIYLALRDGHVEFQDL